MGKKIMSMILALLFTIIIIIIVVVVIITGMTALCEPWPSSELFAILLYSMPHSSSSLHPGF
jgi:hypothetical protein